MDEGLVTPTLALLRHFQSQDLGGQPKPAYGELPSEFSQPREYPCASPLFSPFFSHQRGGGWGTAVTTTILVFQFDLPPGFAQWLPMLILDRKGRGTALSNTGYTLSLSLSLSLLPNGLTALNCDSTGGDGQNSILYNKTYCGLEIK